MSPTKRKTAAPAEVCRNCPEPAVYKTMISAANVDVYCPSCAEKSYPGLRMVEPIG